MKNLTHLDFTDGSLYTCRSAFAPGGEFPDPRHPAFALLENEAIVYDKRKYSSNSNQRAVEAITNGIITDFDKTILFLVATFSSVCITSRMLCELLVLMGYPGENVRDQVDRSVKRLFSYGLLNKFHITSEKEGEHCTAAAMLHITPNGFRIVRASGVGNFYYDAFESTSRSAWEEKRNCGTAQFLISWMKNVGAIRFTLRKTIRTYANNNKEAIVRPSATIVVGSAEDRETLYIETIRRNEGANEELRRKLARYDMVFSYMDLPSPPTIIITGEDEMHTRSVYQDLCRHNAYRSNIVFTHDLAVVGGDFANAFYTYEGEEFVQLHIAA